MWNSEERPPYHELLENDGIDFFIDGERVSPGMVMEVAEESDYMADYVFGKEGKLSEIRFDRIHQE